MRTGTVRRGGEPMKRHIRVLFLLLCALLLLCACAPAAQQGPALWKVTSPDGGELYLFGSIHAAKEALYPLPDAVMQAYASCDALAVEFDITTLNEEAAMPLYSAMLLTDGTTIADHFDDKTCKTMKAILQEAGSYSPLYDAFGPLFWETMLETAALEKANLDAANGVDSYFLSLAHESGREILEVESLDFQIALMTCEEALRDACALVPLLAEHFDTCASYYAHLYEAYAKGDLDALEYFLSGSSERYGGTGDSALDDLIRSMYETGEEWQSEYSIAARNESMAKAAAEYLASGKKVFFVVGAGHMVGPDGIPALLEGMGYTVERTCFQRAKKV